MRVSDARLEYLIKEIVSLSLNEGICDDLEPRQLTIALRKGWMEYEHRRDGIDQKVREKIGRLSRVVDEGSREWGVLYRQYFEEEMNKLG